MGEGIRRKWGSLVPDVGGRWRSMWTQTSKKLFFKIVLNFPGGYPRCSQPAKTACQSRKPIENGVGKPTAHVGWFWSQTPNFEPIELLVPPLSPPDTAVAACFLLKKHTCKVWAGHKGGPVSGRSPRHGARHSPAEPSNAKLERHRVAP